MTTPLVPSTPRTVLILGANGRLGLAAAQAFDRAGWQVLAQVRRAPATGMPAAAPVLAIEPGDTDALVRAAHGASVVVHALNPLYTAWARDALPLARCGMTVAERLGALFMLPGNVYNHGTTMPPVLAPDTPQRPDTRKGRIRCDIEAEMAARPGRSVVIRAGDFYGGDGTGSWIDLVIARSIARGRLTYPGPLDRPHAWAYLPDLARVFVAVAERAEHLPLHATLHFAGHTLTGGELLAALQQAAIALGLPSGTRWRRGSLPWPLLRLGGWVVPMWRELAEMAYLWTTPHALDGAALRQVVGEVANTPVEQAVFEALKAMKVVEPGAHVERMSAAA